MQKETSSLDDFIEETRPLLRSPQSPSSDPSVPVLPVECQLTDAASVIPSGPPIPIHRHQMGQRLIQGLCMIWLWSGCSFLTCATLCISINISYVTYRSEGQMIPLVLGWTCFLWVLWKFYRTVLRTLIRLLMAVGKEEFGAGDQDFWFVRWVDGVASSEWVQSTMHPEKLDRCVDSFKFVLLTLFLCLVVGVPLISVAWVYGYWAVISLFCVVWTVGSAICILLVNVIGRLIRFLRFIGSMFDKKYKDKQVPPRLRAAYLASTENDYEATVLDVYASQGMIVSVVALICSFVFGGLKANVPVIVLTSCLFVFALIIRLRKTLFCWYRVQLDRARDPLLSADDGGNSAVMQMIQGLEWTDYYRGHDWSHVIMVFVMRMISFTVGMSCLVYSDLTFVYPKSDRLRYYLPVNLSPTWELIVWTIIFMTMLVLKDLVFFVRMPISHLRPILLFSIQFLQIAVALCGAIYFKGYTFIAATLLALYEINYREARWFYTNKNPHITKTRGARRAIRNTFLILGLLALFIFTALGVGIVVGGRASVTSKPENVSSEVKYDPPNRNLDGFLSPVCSLQFTRAELSVVDLAFMSLAVYQPDAPAALALIRRNSNLNNWTLGSYNFNYKSLDYKRPNRTLIDPKISNVNVDTGLRFVEFVHASPNVSVIAVRGTYKLEDVFEDMYLWSTVGMLQLSSYFGTLLELWPIRTVALAVYMLTSYFSHTKLIYWDDMENIIRQIMLGHGQIPKPAQSPFGKSFPEIVWPFSNDLVPAAKNSKVMLTGHSLGGGLANIVAGHLGIPSVVFSAPGLGYSIYNYNLTLDAIMRHTLNIIPLHDPVPRFDKQISMEQPLPCNAGQPMACHRMPRTLKTLVDLCSGDEPE